MSIADYNAGYVAGRESRDEEVEALERIADYWHFRANNPGVKTRSQKMIDSIIAGKEANEERERKRAEWDAQEEELFQRARDLIAAGGEDIEVAKEVGLFLPIVQNLRAGVL